MQLQMEKDILLQAAGRTQGVVDRRSHTPILSHFLLEAEDNRLKISATDYEVSFRGYYPAQVLENGGLTVPAINFFNIVKELPSGLITLESTENNNLILKTGTTRYQFLGLSPDNFPPLPRLENHPLIPVKSAMIREVLEKTSFSMSLDDLQPQLTGIYLERLPDSPKIRLVSSDGHRLSLIDRELETAGELELEKGIIIPRKGVVEMLRLLGEEGDCSLGLDKKNLILKQGDDFLFIRLLDKKFPDYRRIIPPLGGLQLTVGRQPFLDILKRMSLLSAEKFKGVILQVSDGWLDFRYHNPEVGGGEEKLPVRMHYPEGETEGEKLELPVEISYNARYLMEPLGVLHGEEVILELIEKKKPLRIREAGDPDHFAIIMPMDL
jgi:DNA polymerase III subunit beta